ncbi:MAG: sialate O-acetylesterase [Verrucomicrobia bacterium]|nr:sialate O-acetylesterase [Verrucomicrobiota bacterium]
MWNLLFIRFLGAASFSVTPSLMSDGGVVQRNETLTYTGRDQPGSTVTFIGFGLEQKTISDDSGNWIIHLPPLTGGMQSDVSFHGSDGAMHFLDLVTGDIWIFVGQSNLIFPLHSSDGSHELLDNPSINPKIRLWNEPRRIAKMNENSYPRGAWVEFRAETLYEFSAVASWFAHALSKNIDVPLGVVVAGWGATHMRSWLPRKTAEEKPFLWPYTLQVDADRLTAWEPIYTDYLSIKKSAAESGVRYFATIPLKPMLTGDLFNGMVEGLTRDKIRGIIYYQGESEVYRPQDLRILMPQIIQSYRSYFQQGDIPFLFVQIPGWDFDRFRSMDEILNEVQQDSAMALLREAQLQVDEVVPMTALVTTMDLGEKG